MAIPSTRDGFRDYCKRALGFGVIDINVSDAQVEDRIDEGLQYFAQYHYDGCLLYTSPSPRDKRQSRMPSSA